MNIRTTWKWIALALVAGGMLAVTPAVLAAATTKERAVWPPAPSEPRIAFVQFITGPRDLGWRPPFWRKLGNWITGDQGESLNLRKPFAIALDERGNICRTDTDARLLCYCDLAKKNWLRFDGAGKTKFVTPVAAARRHGIFYVADSTLGRVFAFKEDGKVLFELGAPLKRPVGLAVTDDEMLVVDVLAQAVFVFDLNGKLVFTFGKRGTGPGEFNYPTSVAVDGRGHLVVSDTLNCRVQVFDMRGKFLSQFGGNGDTSGHFSRPKGVAVDAAGNIYVVDALFDNFQIFNLAGQLLLNVGETGTQPGGFGLPNGIAIGADNRIYVADTFNHRVQVFQYLGQP